MEDRLAALEAQVNANAEVLVNAAFNAEEALLLLKTLTMLLVRDGTVAKDGLMMILRNAVAQYPDAKALILNYRIDSFEEALLATMPAGIAKAH